MAEGGSTKRSSAVSGHSEGSVEDRSTPMRGASSSPRPASPRASPILPRKDDVSSVGTGSDASPTLQRRKELDILMESKTQTTLPGDPPLLPGELLSYIEHKITYLDHFMGSIEGSVFITSYKLYFRSDPNPHNVSENPVILNVPLGAIAHVEKIGRARQKGDNVIYGLDIHCKDIRTIRFAFAHNQESHGRRGMYERLQIVAFPCSYGKNVFAFHFRGDYPDDGWEIYDAESELKRMGVGNDGVPWRLCTLNKKYLMCDTYSSVLAVPASSTDELIQAVAQFRSKGRIPVLSWLHPVTHASITRCSQPLVGLSRRSVEDEQYIQEILRANEKSNRLYIMDARPKVNAVLNMTMGGGYESEDTYVNMDFSFLDIGNIHVMRESLKKLKDICYPDVDDQRWFSNLESTHWLDHIKAILVGAVKVVEAIEHQKSSVLVHCTDGWDRTAQITSLAMLMMDSYFRTIKGFEVLIEKEWLSFGHKFAQRTGHGDKNHSDDQRAPIFLQFIDCVWQLTEQFPTAFEFNEHFLITILDHLHSCLFGTFLFNSEKLRHDNGVKDKTVSVWSFINSQIDVYKNPLYAEHMNNKVLLPRTSIRMLQLWNGYYLRWNPRMKPQESEFERSRQLQILIKLLKEKCQELSDQQHNISSAGEVLAPV